jgi:ribulose-5-phosphate 4-epimerase/fuculose-1-phosphate aldolase
MGNRYQGTKFSTELTEINLFSCQETETLKYWSKKIAGINCSPKLTGGYGGNLSCRYGYDFIITAAGTDLANVSISDLVIVSDFDLQAQTLHAKGIKLPSSESMLHGAIYEARPEISAVFHGHYPLPEKEFLKLNLPITAHEKPYGSTELVNEVLKIVASHSFILLKNHGFLSLGNSPDEAGNQIISTCKTLMKRQKSLLV